MSESDNRQVPESAHQGLLPAMDSGPRPYPGVWQAILLAVLVLLFQALFATAAKAVAEAGHFTLTAGTTLIFSNVLAFGTVLLLALRKVRLPFKEVLPLFSVPSALWIPMGCTVIGCSIVLSELSNLMVYIWPPPVFLERMMIRLHAETVAVRLPLLVLVAPLTEEFLMRGVFLQGFLRRYSMKKAVFLSALLFAVFHLNPWQFVAALTTGVLFAWWRIRTASLWPGIFGHALNNGLGLITLDLLRLEIPGYTPHEGPVVFQPIWFDVLGVALLAAGLWLTARVLRSSKEPLDCQTTEK